MNAETYPAKRDFSQLGFNHSPETDLLQKVRSEVPEKVLPFILDGFVDRCIAVTDHALFIREIEIEEYRYGAL